MNNELLINEVQKLTGISNIANLNQKDAVKIIELVGSNQIKQKNIEAIIAIYPHLTKIFSESILTLRESINGISENQNEMIKGATTVFENTSQILGLLAKSAENDETRLIIVNTIMTASDRYYSIISELKEINKNILKTAKMNMITTIGGGILSALGGLVSISFGDSNGVDCENCENYNCPCKDCDDDCDYCSYNGLSCEELMGDDDDDDDIIIEKDF